MKRNIISIFYVIYSLCRLSLLKIFHFEKLSFSYLNVISPFAEITLDSGAFLKLGKPMRIKSGAKIRVREGAELSIGNNTYINHGCFIVSHKRITIGNNVQFGPNVLVYDHDHDFRVGLINEEYLCSSVEIGDNVWVGANTVILRGTKIGDNSVIGAGSVIKGEFPKNTVIVQKRDTTQYFIKR
ncbi:acyltransferase [Paenibacillus sp. Soil750]|uniref:acyltransferase n=1 Tax=Paenibacillus sp. Soil750 TaxID=1736398 RepID=UPI0006F2AA6C|nr:acyltransferase [Paenibacillus sp. Soil750]KRE57659.1 hypothetical protein ASL11_32675 [Paenibacillus sp. Soil750]